MIIVSIVNFKKCRIVIYYIDIVQYYLYTKAAKLPLLYWKHIVTTENWKSQKDIQFEGMKLQDNK